MPDQVTIWVITINEFLIRALYGKLKELEREWERPGIFNVVHLARTGELSFQLSFEVHVALVILDSTAFFPEAERCRALLNENNATQERKVPRIIFDTELDWDIFEEKLRRILGLNPRRGNP